MRFVLIRHGQSTNNALWAETGDEHGREADTRLTALGEAQAAALAAYAGVSGIDTRSRWRRRACRGR